MDLDRLVEELVRDEGERLRVYKDSLGIETIGVGRNLRDKGITKAESRFLLDNDIDECVADLGNVPWFARLPESTQRGLLNMRFNLGPSRFWRWQTTLGYFARGDVQGGAQQFRTNRKYKAQIGDRFERIARLLEGVESSRRTP